MLIVIALLYVLFAAIDGRLAIIGYERSAWWLVAGYALHGGWDLFQIKFSRTRRADVVTRVLLAV